MSEFGDGPGHVIQETLEYLSKLDLVVSGRLVAGESLMEDDEDSFDGGTRSPRSLGTRTPRSPARSAPRSRTSTSDSNPEECVYHGGPILELREFFSKLNQVATGKLIAGDSPFDDDDFEDRYSSDFGGGDEPVSDLEDEVQDEAATTTDPSLNAPVPTMAEDDGDAGWCFDYDDEDGGSDDNGNNGRTNSDEEVREDAYFSFYGSDSDCSYG